jgi:hypothetical protein
MDSTIIHLISRQVHYTLCAVDYKTIINTYTEHPSLTQINIEHLSLTKRNNNRTKVINFKTHQSRRGEKKKATSVYLHAINP